MKAALKAVVLLTAGAVLACGEARRLSDGRSVARGCTECHGGSQDLTGAPPSDAEGRTSTALVTVGAHSAHVVAGTLARAFDCSECHVKPGADRVHASGPVVQFATAPGTIAASNGATPQWLPAAAAGPSCATTYCHGGFQYASRESGNALTIVGNVENAPVWTRVDSTQARCGTCHGDPDRTDQPPSLPRGHFGLAAGSTNATCAVCHGSTVDTDGEIVPGGGHLNGAADVDGAAVHPDGWMTVDGPQFHGAVALAQAGTAACLRCHSVELPARVTTFACATCHGSGFVAP